MESCLLKNINQSTKHNPLYPSPLESPFLKIMGLWKAKQMARNQGVRDLLLYYLLMAETHRQYDVRGGCEHSNITSGHVFIMVC